MRLHLRGRYGPERLNLLAMVRAIPKPTRLTCNRSPIHRSDFSHTQPDRCALELRATD